MRSLEVQERREGFELPGDYSRFRYSRAPSEGNARKDVFGREMDYEPGYRMTKKRDEANASEMRPDYGLCICPGSR